MVVYPTVMQKEGVNPWVSYMIQQATRQNKCINAISTGMPGAGKSWGLIYLLEQSDPTFNIDRVFFRASEMLRWIKDGGLKKKGTAFMLDEAGIDASSMKWWDEVNRGLNAFFQTGRSYNYIFGMTVPFITLISKGVRNLMNVRLYANGNKNNRTIFRRVFTLEYNDDMDKVYKKKLWVRRKGGGAFCTGVKLPQASKELLDEYEKRKEEFKISTYDNIVKNLEMFERKKKEKESQTGVLTKGQQEHYDLRWSNKTTLEACGIRGVKIREGQRLEQMIRQRGKMFPEDMKIQSQIQKLPIMSGSTRENEV